MKPIYQCDWCGKRDTEDEIRVHEPLCIYNKELHSCYTCKNKQGLTKVTCSIGRKIDKGKYFQFCSLWEDNGKDMTKPGDFEDIFNGLFGDR